MRGQASEHDGRGTTWLLATDGMLVKRPFVVDGDLVLTGFREAEWKEKLI